MGLAPRPHGPPGGEDTLERQRVGGELFPPVPPRVALPDARGPLEVLVRASYRFFGLSWETSSHSKHVVKRSNLRNSKEFSIILNNSCQVVGLWASSWRSKAISVANIDLDSLQTF